MHNAGAEYRIPPKSALCVQRGSVWCRCSLCRLHAACYMCCGSRPFPLIVFRQKSPTPLTVGNWNWIVIPKRLCNARQNPTERPCKSEVAFDFRNRKLWRPIGSKKVFCSGVRKQHCCLKLENSRAGHISVFENLPKLRPQLQTKYLQHLSSNSLLIP